VDKTVHPDFFKSNDETIQNINAKMPEGYKVQDVLRDAELRKYREGSVQAGSAINGEMDLNSYRFEPDMWSTQEDLENMYKSKTAINAVKNMNPVQTFTHEVGHLVHDKFIKDTTGTTDMAKKEKFVKSIRKEVLDKFNLTAKKQDAWKVSKQLSEYGSSSAYEFFAEAFAENIDNPNPRPMAKEFWKVLMNKLDKV
jgi:hypothetical protein